MKILHIQTRISDYGNAAYRLHLAMLNQGLESFTLSNVIQGEAKNSYKIDGSISFLNKVLQHLIALLYKLVKKPNSYFYSSSLLISNNIYKSNLVKQADVIYIHWICNFLSLRDIEYLAKTGKTIVFYMHDMWTMTGGCHHSFECEGYKTGCRNCPMFSSLKCMPKRQNEEKKILFSKYNNLFFVSPSEWLFNCAKSSLILKDKPIYVIPNIVDENVFHPIDKVLAKKQLHLTLNKKIITFGCSAGTSNPYKGWRYLQKALKSLKNKDNYLLVVYGSDYGKETGLDLPIIYMGTLNEKGLALLDNATDIFISPSLAESFGLTFLENILCDTPVIGFNNTAIPEIVKTGATGYLAENKNSDDLVRGIDYLMHNPLRVYNNINYSSSNVVKEHLKLLKNIIKQ